jgi:hypothetical protein
VLSLAESVKLSFSVGRDDVMYDVGPPPARGSSAKVGERATAVEDTRPIPKPVRQVLENRAKSSGCISA